MPPRPKPGALAAGSNPVPSSITRRRSGVARQLDVDARRVAVARVRDRLAEDAGERLAHLGADVGRAGGRERHAHARPRGDHRGVALRALARAARRAAGARCSIAQRESSSARSAATDDVARRPAGPSSRAARRRMNASSCATPSCRSRAIRRRSRSAARAATALATSSDRRPQQHEAEQQPQHVTDVDPVGPTRRQQGVVDLGEREEQHREPEPAANASPERAPRPVRPTAARAKQQRPRAGARARPSAGSASGR